jgi:RHS repeat-associated protein
MISKEKSVALTERNARSAELDEETGLYYYGARYYNPRESIFLSVDPLAEMMPSVSPYAYTFQNPIKFTDPTGMLPEDSDNDPDPPTGKRDIYESRPVEGGRKLTKTKTVSSGSDQNDAFVNVVDKDGYSIKAYTGANAVAEYTNDYGLLSDVEMIMSDGLNGFERTLFSIGEVTYIAFTNIETSAIILAPLEEFVLARASAGSFISSYTRKGMSNAEVRSWYSARVKKINTALSPTEANAKYAVSQRNSLKKRARDMMSDRSTAKQLDKTNPINGYEYYYKKYYNQGYRGESLYKRIMEGSTTPNKAVNKKFGL